MNGLVGNVGPEPLAIEMSIGAALIARDDEEFAFGTRIGRGFQAAVTAGYPVDGASGRAVVTLDDVVVARGIFVDSA